MTEFTAYHAKYFAHDLSRRATDSLDRFSGSLNQCVQTLIEASLVAKQTRSNPSIIVGGRSESTEDGLTVFADPFTIHRQSDHEVFVSCDLDTMGGHQQHCTTLTAAVGWLIGQYSHPSSN